MSSSVVLTVMIVLAVSVVSAYAQATDLSTYDIERQEAAKAMVNNAITAFATDMNTTLAAIQDVDNPIYHDGDLYVFVIDENQDIISHGADPTLVGVNSYTLEDERGTNLGELFEEHLSHYPTWIQYYWPNPATGYDGAELKLTWAESFAGYTFGVGMYPDSPEPFPEVDLSTYDIERQEAAKAMVNNAITAFATDMNTTLAAIQDVDNPIYHDGDLYVFVIDENQDIISHGADPTLVGVNSYTLEDERGTNLGELFEEHLSHYPTWIQYYWPNPATGYDGAELKLTWAESFAGYTFGVGMYPDSPEP